MAVPIDRSINHQGRGERCRSPAEDHGTHAVAAAMTQRLPLTAAICLALSLRAAFAQDASRRQPQPHSADRSSAGRDARDGHGHRAEAHRKPAEGADQHPGAGRGEARGAERHRLRRLRQVPAERLLPDASARASRRSTCAAWPAAATATTPARCRASACTSTSSRSPPSRARSTSTSTTSPASRRWPARRARCTAPARRPARCASSPTSPTRAASRPATASRSTASSDGGIGHVAEGFVNMPLGDNAAIRLVGWDKHDAGYIDNKPGDRAPFPDARRTDAPPAGAAC